MVKVFRVWYNDGVEEDITEEEVKKAVMLVENRKAGGLDGVRNGMVKNAGENVQKLTGFRECVCQHEKVAVCLMIGGRK